MKICFVTTNFPRYLGDSEGTFVWEAARAVASHGHQVKVIAQHWPGTPTHEWMEDVEIFRPRYWWPESAEMLRREGGGLPIIWKKSWLARLQMIPFILVHTLATAYYARNCDIIHAQWTLSAGAAWLSKFIHRCPIVVTLHGSDIFQAARGQVGVWLTRLILQHGCAQIIAVSRALCAAAAELGIPAESIEVIPDGVNLSQFTPSPHRRTLRLVYVGTLIKRKGLNYLLDAMPNLMPNHPDLQLTIIGDGPERPALESMAHRLNLADRVTFTGQLPPKQVRAWMQQAKLFVLPSVEEGLGVVLLEALACATPIVASRVGGIPDVVTPEVGRLVPPGDSAALATAINHLLQNEPAWAIMSHNARKRAETEYDWYQIAARFITIYQGILN